MPRSFRTARLRQSLRRKTSWTVGPTTGTGGSRQSITAAGATLATLGAQINADSITVVRVRGSMLLQLSTAASGLDGFHGAMGIGVVTQVAFDIGVTALPTPITEEAWDGWLYHQFFQLVASDILDGSAATDKDTLNPVTATLRVDVDSKAMRKLNSDMVIVAVLEVAEEGAATLQWSFRSRMLVKLP